MPLSDLTFRLWRDNSTGIETNEPVTLAISRVYTSSATALPRHRRGVPLAVERKKEQAEITTSTRRGSTVRRHYVQPLSPPANPFIHRSFPDGKNTGEGLRRGCLSTKRYGTVSPSRYRQNVAGGGKEGLEALRGEEGEEGEGPWRTCRSGSSKGRIIRADRIVLLVIQIRLSYPALRRPGISRQLRQRERVIFLREIPRPRDRSSSWPFKSIREPLREREKGEVDG